MPFFIASPVNGWFCAAFGRRTARKVRKRKTTVDRDRSQLSIKKRTTKKGGDGEEGAFLAWVCSSSGVHDPRCDHSRTVARNLYPGSVAGVGGFRLGRLGLSSSKTLVPRAIVNGSKYLVGTVRWHICQIVTAFHAV